MNPTTVGTLVFTCTSAGVLFGMWLHVVLPANQFDADAKDTVKVGVGLIATMTALVLGLVTASAKGSFDAVDAAVKQTSTDVLALDRVLARYGSETAQIRKSVKDMIGARLDIVWPQGSSAPVSLEALASGESLSEPERVADAIQRLQPHDDSQRALQKRALDLAEALLQARWLVTDSSGAAIPVPFLAVLVSWLTIIFASFGLFAPRSAIVVTALFVCALSVGSAVFLILEMGGAFDGLLQVSSDPMRYAYAHLNQ